MPRRQHPEIALPAAHGNHHHQPLMMAGNCAVLPLMIQTIDTLDDSNFVTLTNLMRDQAQRRAQVSWAEQRHYPGEPEFMHYEQRSHRAIHPDADQMDARDRLAASGVRPSGNEMRQQRTNSAF